MSAAPHPEYMTDADDPREAEALVDVWSRTEPRYRIRAALLLGVNLLLFIGLCVFCYWLRETRLFDFSWGTYAAPAGLSEQSKPTLNDFLTDPISVEQNPFYIAVLGLLLAAMVAVPIVVAILYRFGSAMPFVAAVLVFAHMPGLALTLLLSCVLAAVRPFRLQFRFGAALLGMLPVLVYLYFATRDVTDRFSTAAPVDSLQLLAPWVLMILAACVMMGLVLVISRVVNYRPGAVAPVVAVMFATPVVLFHVKVGVDELRYRILESHYGPRSKLFDPAQTSTETREEIARMIGEAVTPPWTGDTSHLLEDFWGGDVVIIKRRIALRMLADFLADRREAFQACSKFIADHPDSRYIPNVLYIQARAMDTRIDEHALYSDHPRRVLYSNFPHVQSRNAWSALFAKHPNSPLRIAAGLRLAQLDLRRGDAAAAAEKLAEALRTAAETPAAASQPASGLLAVAPPEVSLEYDPAPDVFEVRRLLELIRANLIDPARDGPILAEVAHLDPHRDHYADQLLRLIAAHPDAPIVDNLLVTWAQTVPGTAERARVLTAIVARYPDGDAAAAAEFHLAELETLALGKTDAAARQRGVTRLEGLRRRWPESCWASAARERLELLRQGQPTATRETSREAR